MIWFSTQLSADKTTLLHDRPWISPWIKSISSELDVTFHVHQVNCGVITSVVQSIVISSLECKQIVWGISVWMCENRLFDRHSWAHHGPLARYVKLRVAHAPEMPGTSSPPPRVSDPDMHRGTCVTRVPWCMPRSLTSGFLSSRRRGKRTQLSRRTRNPQFYVSGKRPVSSKK